MGLFRFRRSFSIIPGVRLNLGKRGVSMSVGPRGAKMTIGPTGTRVTAGLPGTGLSYTEKLGGHHRVEPDANGEIEPQRRPAMQQQPGDVTSLPASSGFTALGWVVAAILFVLLVVALS
jgi:hypothetical protein